MIVGVGVASAADLPLMRRAADALDPGVLVRYYCTPDVADAGGPSCDPSPDPAAALVGDLVGERIDAAVRGTLPANRTLALLRAATGVDRLERVALLECADGRRFLLAPVGVDEGWTVAEKVALIGRGRELARLLDLPPGVGVLSGGRLGDLGRHPAVDRSMADAELAARLGDGVHCEILIEEAVERCGLVIAPDGIRGQPHLPDPRLPRGRKRARSARNQYRAPIYRHFARFARVRPGPPARRDGSSPRVRSDRRLRNRKRSEL